MAKLVRYQQCGCFHFVTFSCYRRQSLLGVAAAYGILERELEAVRLRYGFVVAGYVLMPEHVHLLVGEPRWASLSVALRVLKQQRSRKLKGRGSPQREPDRPAFATHCQDGHCERPQRRNDPQTPEALIKLGGIFSPNLPARQVISLRGFPQTPAGLLVLWCVRPVRKTPRKHWRLPTDSRRTPGFHRPKRTATVSPERS